jgi:nucleoside-diphosphate-sugar epimerase
MSQNILITGASGLVGRHLIDSLVNEEYRLYALYYLSEPSFTHENVTWIKCDLQTESLPVIRDKIIDVIVHCAALTPTTFISDESCYIANTVFDAKVLDFCNSNPDTAIIYLSSIYIEKYKTDELIEHSKYLYRKWQSEQQIFQLKNRSICLRISSPYGIHQMYRNVLKKFLENAVKGENIFIYGTGSRTQDFIAANDVAEAILLVIKNDLNNEILNICSSQPVSMKELATIVADVAENKIAVELANQPDAQEEYRADFNNTVARQKLNWYPATSLHIGIAEWYKFLKK